MSTFQFFIKTIASCTLLMLLFNQCQDPTSSRANKLVVWGSPTDAQMKFVNQLQDFAQAEGYSLHIMEQKDIIHEDSLKPVSALFLLGDLNQLTSQQQRTIERYHQSGGGVSAWQSPLNRYQWGWYHQLTSSPLTRTLLLNDESTNSDGLGNQLKALIAEDNYDPRKVTLPIAPQTDRFTITELDAEINEPMQMAVLPSGKVLFVEREGKIKIYDPHQKTTKEVAHFEVSTQGNYEDGLLGVTIDPQYHKNNWIYLFYSPAIPKPVQYVSRFRLAYEDSLLLATEKVVLEIPVQRETCCHSGGGLEFGPGGLLYISTGDNTSSKESDGFSPLDERPGRAPFDAQKSSGNTHDLRGKILRIKPLADGTYKIPPGNLFPKDGSKGRPEIYVMGCRNPFRFSIDARTGFLYWGDVGPDGGKDGPQGPQSYDEWNQARQAGNYGWPYFVADNKAYNRFDFATGEVGPAYDPQHPVNESPNNYGARELPIAQEAMIWYAYGESSEWPMLGTGSRSAMAGPVYYHQYRGSNSAFPSYYEGKLFMYEWARSWIKLASFDESGDLTQIEDFLPELAISKPIDLEFGPEGALYILTYGANYFANNEDARLIKIEYAEGNRKPIPHIITSTDVGAVPLKVDLDATQSQDHDQEPLSFIWMVNDSIISDQAQDSFTFNEAGSHRLGLWAIDQHGDSALAEVQIKAGNAPPQVQVSFAANSSFYFDDQPFAYEVAVTDTEDGSSANNEIVDDQVVVNFNYLPQGQDWAHLGDDLFKQSTRYLEGRTLMDASDCSTCHDYKVQSRGPSYFDIAQRYQSDQQAVSALAQKIINGGGGVWGNTLMAAHPQLTLEQTTAMVQYILTLGQEHSKVDLPMKGEIQTSAHQGSDNQGQYIFTAYYQDQGNRGATNLDGYQIRTLRAPLVQAESYNDFSGVSRQRPQGGSLEYVNANQAGSYITFTGIDLKDISSLRIRTQSRSGGNVVVRMDQPDGPVWSTVNIASGEWQEIEQSVTTQEGIHDLYFSFEGTDPGSMNLNLDWIRFQK